MSFSFTNPEQNRDDRSFSFTDPQPRSDDRSFSFTAHADVEQKLDVISDMAREILRLVAEVRRQIDN
ncbi:hypothetical protein OTB20_32725 [Streptomyces sp. H27-H1]|uniref:hypothetical protein n=1 Tax=unclassified Streptomyces TaxID=2593676 RepID=UPI00226EBEAA|nr:MULTISPECIES: hypothetical protein [unclassified Streptomyces]MCY0930875.1 hypothetical protein [Streptomyces sp. H27-H1]MDJ0465997.1 hypothetical protein [Streptomyces sp. H27-C3]